MASFEECKSFCGILSSIRKIWIGSSMFHYLSLWVQPFSPIEHGNQIVRGCKQFAWLSCCSIRSSSECTCAFFILWSILYPRMLILVHRLECFNFLFTPFCLNGNCFNKYQTKCVCSSKRSVLLLHSNITWTNGYNLSIMWFSVFFSTNTYL